MILSAEVVDELKHAPSSEGILTAIQRRWSPRAFGSRDVSDADLTRLFEAARWAPSAYNEQPWRFLVARRGTDTHRTIISSLIPFNRLWAPEAPVLILGVARKRFSHDQSENIYAPHDLGAATVLLTVEAAALGLVTHQMGGFDHEAARKALAIPDDYLMGTVIALGYQGEPALLANERMMAQETAPRTRRPLREFVLSAWDIPAPLGRSSELTQEIEATRYSGA